MTMQMPLAAGCEQAVDNENAQNLLPVGAFTRAGQTGAEEVIKVKAAPELIAQPTRAPLTRTFETQRFQAHLDSGRAVGRWLTIGGKQGELAAVAPGFVENTHRALPSSALAVVQLAQIQHVSLGDFAARVAVTLHHGPRAMHFAVFTSLTAFQEHARTLADPLPPA